MGNSRFCEQLCIETLYKRAILEVHLTNVSFELFSRFLCIFTEDASLLLLSDGAKIQNDQKLRSRGLALSKAGSLKLPVGSILEVWSDGWTLPQSAQFCHYKTDFWMLVRGGIFQSFPLRLALFKKEHKTTIFLTSTKNVSGKKVIRNNESILPGSWPVS